MGTADTRIIVASCSLAVLLVTAFTWLSSYPVDFAIPCVLLWALGGVYAELNDPLPSIPATFSERQINGIQMAVLVGMCLIGAGIVAKALYVLLKQRPEALKAQEASSKASESEEAEESV